MAVFGRYYHLQFKQSDRNQDNVFVENDVHIRIYDLSLEGDDTIAWHVTELDGSGDPFRTSSIDNGEDKFTGIKPTQATIKFISTDSVNIATFADSVIDTAAGGVDPGDPRWYVEAFLNLPTPSSYIFKGFLNLDDCAEAFMPLKNEVVLVANDGLGGLKNIPLTKPDGTNPTNENRIADYLAWSLQKTGLNLNLNAIFNIREKTLGTSHFFDVIYPTPKTFEDQIGTSISCFDVIEQILGEEAFLTQRGGEWWIVRVDELGNNNGYYRAVFDSDGVYQSIDSELFLIKTIEKDSTGIFFSQEATIVNLLRPHKSIQETYDFQYPIEIIDNIDFSRGALNSSLPNETIDGISYFAYKYDIDDWTLYTPGLGILGTAYIKKLFTDTNKTYEKSRYLVIDPNSASTTPNWLKSRPLPINKSDKFDLNFDVRFRDDVTGSGDFWVGCAIVVLEGEDGSVWVCGTNGTDPNAKDAWVNVNINLPGTIQGSSRGAWLYQQKSDDQTKWAGLSLSSPPAPVSGNLYLIFEATDFLTNPRYFSNIQFTYTPFINGDYSKYSASIYKIFRDENLVNKREKQVYISDAIQKAFKGALCKIGQWVTFFTSTASFNTGTNNITVSTATEKIRTLLVVGDRIQISGTANNNGIFTVVSLTNSGINTIIHVAESLNFEGGTPTTTFQKIGFTIANSFYAWNDIHTSIPDDIYCHPYGYIQAFDVWNQYRNTLRKFQATLQGLGYGSVDQSTLFLSYPSLVHRYYLQDTNDNTNDRYFMLLSFDIDWKTCEWTGTLIECYNTTTGKHYDDNLETKYIQ
jgi:hypothetical protein